MKVREIIRGIDCKVIQGDVDKVEIFRLSRNSKDLEGGELFFCIKGNQFDTHELAEELIEKGARALVVEKNLKISNKEIVLIKVDKVRKSMGPIAANFYGHPAKKMTLIALIGTKGKSTTAAMIKHILTEGGHKTGLIGSVGIHNGKTEIPSTLTTPDADDLQRYLCEMFQNGCEYVVMEVSSQSYPMARTEGIEFDLGIFTNISPDHIGELEHKDFDDYFNSKKNLLKSCKRILYNADAELSDRMMEGLELETFSVSIETESDFKAKNLHLINEKDHFGSKFLVGENAYKLGVPGKFNVYNALLAIRAAELFGIPYETISRTLENFSIIGRMEPVVSNADFLVLIDFAHNAASLETVLKSLRQYKHERIVCLFGCVGGRSKLRRLEMGKCSGELADFTILSSDNPCFEEPEAIIKDIVEGISKTGASYVEIIDRKEAIRYAINHAKKGDVILLAGKGHETYQEIKGVRYEMNEREIVLECMREREAREKR